MTASTVPTTTPDDVDRLVEAAGSATTWASGQPPAVLADVLDAIATAIEEVGTDVVASADEETALGSTRLSGELDRTTGQLRFLGEHVRAGHHLDAVVDTGNDLRRVRLPVGPVAVFAASNFPLAFSVAGGDTAAALASGCPALVKAHPLHPRTSDLVARAVARGIAAADAPAGLFGLVHGFEAGRQLVLHPAIRSVAFTGSPAGGRAIADLARSREVPVPVHAEMGAINPVVVTPTAMHEHPDEVLDGWVGSFTLGVGQFCTNPGVVFVPAESLDVVREGLHTRLDGAPVEPMLGRDIRDGWRERTESWAEHPRVEVVRSPDAGDGATAGPAVLATDAGTWAATPVLHEECFGPTTLAVAYTNRDELLDALRALPGSLVGAVHAGRDEDLAADVHRLLRDRVGRLVHGGWPTGVAVAHGMHHGGPWPASTDGRHTSVGSAAVDRFLRPVAHQGVPEELLPPPLQDANPWGVPQRRV